MVQKGFRDKLEKYVNMDAPVLVSVMADKDADFCIGCYELGADGKALPENGEMTPGVGSFEKNAVEYNSLSDKEVAYRIDFTKINPAATKLVFVMATTADRGMEKYGTPSIRVTQATGSEANAETQSEEEGRDILGFAAVKEDITDAKTVVFAEIYKKDVWRFAAVCGALKTSLKELEDSYAVKRPKPLEPALKEAFDTLNILYPEKKVFLLDLVEPKLQDLFIRYAAEEKSENMEAFLKQYGYQCISGNEIKKLRAEVFCKPGEEPDLIKRNVTWICKKLELAYPDHVIRNSIQKTDKDLAAAVGGMYQWFGYKDAKVFLEAYGFTYDLNGTGAPAPARQESMNTFEEMHPQGTNPAEANPQGANPAEANPQGTNAGETTPNETTNIGADFDWDEDIDWDDGSAPKNSSNWDGGSAPKDSGNWEGGNAPNEWDYRFGSPPPDTDALVNPPQNDDFEWDDDLEWN